MVLLAILHPTETEQKQADVILQKWAIVLEAVTA
jgi:hypothetical protein